MGSNRVIGPSGDRVIENLTPTCSVISLKRRLGLPMYNQSVRNDGARFFGLTVGVESWESNHG